MVKVGKMDLQKKCPAAEATRRECGKKNGASCRSRTNNDLENPPQNSSKSPPWALIGALADNKPIPIPPDLLELIQLWSKLSEHDKQIILLIARNGGDLND